MIISAGWVEGLYLGTQISSKSEDVSPKLLERIAEQKVSLKNLIGLVDSYNMSGSLNFILDDLRKIEDAYQSINVTESEASTSMDAEGVTTIGGKTEVIISDEDLANLTTVVSEIRQAYVQL
jgi:uncharacterized protein YjgD (DUF1641 family)